MKRLMVGAIVLGVVVVASVTQGQVEMANLPSDCVKLKISHSDDVAAGSRYAMGEDIDTTWVADVVICPGTPGSVGGPKLGGTLFMELVGNE